MSGGIAKYLLLVTIGLLSPEALHIGALGWGSAWALDRSGQVRLLTQGETVQGKLTASPSRYEFELKPGMFLRLALLAEAPVQIVFADPAGRALTQASLAADSEVPVSAISSTSGRYALSIQPKEANVTGIAYRLGVAQIRPSHPEDQERLRADRLILQPSVPTSRQLARAAQNAVPNLERAGRIYQQLHDRDSVAILIRTGQAYSQAEDFIKAAAALKAAVRRSRDTSDPSLESWALNAVSAVYVIQGHGAEAASASQESLKLARATRNPWLEARALQGLGEAQYLNGYIEEALQSDLEAADLWSRLNWRRGEAEALLNLAYARGDLGEEQKALTALTRAETLWRALGDKTKTAETLRTFGIFYSKLDEKQKALDFYLQARELLPAYGERRMTAVLSNSTGWVYYDLGELGLAERYFREALELARAIGYSEGEGSCLHGLGLVSFARRHYRRAGEYYEQSLPVFRKMGNNWWASILALDIGTVLLAEGRTADALVSLNEALQLTRQHTGPYEEARCLEAIGQAYQASGQHDRAFESYTQALALRQAGGYRYLEAQTRLLLARLERDRGNLQEAYRQSASGVELIESVRTNVPGPEFRASYFASTHDYFEFHTDLLMRLHDEKASESLDAIAFQVTERGRARSLLDRLAESQVTVREGVDPALLAREAELNRSLNRAAGRQADLPANAKAELASTANKIENLDNEYEQVEALIRMRSPKYAGLMQPKLLTLGQVQRDLLDGDTILLEYTLGEECSYLWAVSKDSYHSYRLPGRIWIEKSALRIRTLVTAYEATPGATTRERRLRIQEAESHYWGAAMTLSEALLGPISTYIGNKRLVIVTDGALDYVPFAALPVPGRNAVNDPVPLVVEHELIRLPSASSLAVIRSETAGRRQPQKQLAAIADPIFEADDPRLPKRSQSLGTVPSPRSPKSVGSESNISYRRLAWSHNEAEAITKLTPIGQSFMAVGFDANLSLMSKGDLSTYRIVHFATHVTAHYEQPELSGVALSKFDRTGLPQEGFLRLHDIYNLRLPVDLVVLSGCESYLGKEVRGEGLLGIVRGFMYAGAKRVIASMWKVDDLATKELMVRFYQNIFNKGLTPAAALRQAQIEMWRSPDWRPPYYWAAFLLQGDWK
ncbi:MAG: CHAT domain-containing tetratricopeptide repeat protein [Bryobacteraceae bacterium]